MSHDEPVPIAGKGTDSFEKVISDAVMTAVEGCSKGDAIGIEISEYVERCERIAEELK